jgi:hypothetical protein
MEKNMLESIMMTRNKVLEHSIGQMEENMKANG